VSRPKNPDNQLSPQLLLRAYSMGIFPMAESQDDPTVFWVDPEIRGIIPLETFHVSKSLRKKIRSGTFEITCDTAFERVMRCCADHSETRTETWINDDIIHAYTELHEYGFAHSVEAWQDGELVGGLYGVSMGAAFFGESMFSRKTDASKVALVHLVARMKQGGFQLLDTQFVTDHLKRFGAVEIPARQYLELLEEALQQKAEFSAELPKAELDKKLEEVFALPSKS
jgi:leucyl/phenylalanyl-tRNA---protein transferase